jgi:VanZ family protein
MIRKGFTVTGWLTFVFIVLATLSPIQYRPVFAGPQLEHFAAFAVLGTAFGLAYPNRSLLVVAFVLGSAVGLEALQLLTPDRHGQVIDAVMKILGGIFGITVSLPAPLLLRALQSPPAEASEAPGKEISARKR